MELKHPHVLWLLLIWIPMVWVYVRRERRARPAVRMSSLDLVRAGSKPFRARFRHMVFVLRLLGLGLLIVALARPRKGNTQEEVTTEGVDIMLVLDVSTSMRALDFKPSNRLNVARETTIEFVNKRRHDRIGLVIFAARAYTKCPLTLDYDILTEFIDQVDFGGIEDGTAIGTAIATAGSRLNSSRAKSRVLILLTDGVSNRGDVAPLTAAQAAANLGMTIYTIGVGKEGKVPYPFQYRDPWRGKVVTKVQMVDSELDEETLQKMADISGGRYFRAHNTDQLREIYTEIDKLEKTEIKTMSYTSYTEKFFPWLLAGALLLLFELVLTHTVFRRIP
jgi:Ca-activated chloride channel family protein